MTPENGPAQLEPAWLDALDAVGRIVLTTDGTVTPLLERIVGEPIVTSRLVQEYRPVDEETCALLAASTGSELLSRKADLVGARSRAVYVRAASVAVPDVLPPRIRHGLVRGDEPIGLLLRRHRVETFREILMYGAPEGWETGAGFRRYRVFIGGAPAFLISETFAAACLRGPTTAR